MYDVYAASVENVDELRKRAKNVKRMINTALRNGKSYEVETLTKVYSMMYSSFAEGEFIKMIHTPHGFDDNKSVHDDKIKQILNGRNLEEKWKKCMEFALAYLDKDGETANKKQKLERILQEYILNPSFIRNKIAHGQLKKCLNNECTRVNEYMTEKMNNLDYTQIDRYFTIYDKFSMIIEDLIESPEKAHYRDYYARLVDLENYIDETSGYCIEDKKRIVKRKKLN